MKETDEQTLARMVKVIAKAIEDKLPYREIAAIGFIEGARIAVDEKIDPLRSPASIRDLVTAHNKACNAISIRMFRLARKAKGEE